MSAGTQISQFEKAQDIPRGTTFVAEMGDGSGTKGITQEVLTKKVGEGLKIGNTEELQTKNKDSLVGAINEAAQKGGGGTSADIDILDSREEIEANTESRKVAGALAVKEMFSGLKGFEPVLDDAGQMVGYKTQVGADTVFPFTKNNIEEIIKADASYYSGKKGTEVDIPVTIGKKYLVIVASVGSGSGYRYVLSSGGNILYSSTTSETGSSTLNSVTGYVRNEVYIIQATADTFKFTHEASANTSTKVAQCGAQIRCIEI